MYVELLAVAVALTTHCVYCIEIHCKSALESIATEAELTEAIHVATALCAGGAITPGTFLNARQVADPLELWRLQITALNEEKIVVIGEGFKWGLDHEDCQ
jgi:AhpD family alkylhydroperoxidase